jgi:hypothetical protein
MKPPEFGQPELSNNESEAIHNIKMSRKHVNYEEDKNKVTMNKPYNIQNTNICNGIFHISFFKALLQWYFPYFIF